MGFGCNVIESEKLKGYSLKYSKDGPVPESQSV